MSPAQVMRELPSAKHALASGGVSGVTQRPERSKPEPLYTASYLRSLHADEMEMILPDLRQAMADGRVDWSK